MDPLFILTLYGATGFYKSRPLSYAEAANLFFSLSDAGAIVSLSEVHL